MPMTGKQKDRLRFIAKSVRAYNSSTDFGKKSALLPWLTADSCCLAADRVNRMAERSSDGWLAHRVISAFNQWPGGDAAVVWLVASGPEASSFAPAADAGAGIEF